MQNIKHGVSCKYVGYNFFQRQINYTFQTYLFKPKNLEVEVRTLSRRYDTYNAFFLSWRVAVAVAGAAGG